MAFIHIHSAASEGVSTNTTTTLASKLAPSVVVPSPGGRILVDWSAELASSGTTRWAEVEVQWGAVVYAKAVNHIIFTSDEYCTIRGFFYVDSVSASTVTLEMLFRRVGAAQTVSIRRARFTVWMEEA